MSIIAKKKAQQQKGPETIFIYMGLIFFIGALAGSGLILIYDNATIDSLDLIISMDILIPLLYFSILGAVCWGLAIAIRNNIITIDNFNDWYIGFSILGVIGAMICGAHIW